jgi:hypothetical protein
LKLFEGGAAVAVFSSAVVPPLRAIYMALLTRCKMTVHLAFVIIIIIIIKLRPVVHRGVC